MDEEMVQSSLQFLRTASACKLIVKAVAKNCLPAGKAWTPDDLNNIESTFVPAYQLNQGQIQTDELQCGLDTEFIAHIRN